MNLKHPLKHLHIIASIMIVLWGCGSSKDSSQSAPAHQQGAMTPSQRYDAIVDRYDDWTTLSIPVKLSLEQPKSFSITGKAYLVKNKSVLISLRVLGMEVGTVFLTNDSIFATDKVHRYYVAESLKSILASYPLTIEDIQSMLIGQPFIAGNGTLDSGDKKSVNLQESPLTGEMTITPRQQINDINYWFTVDKANSLDRLTVSLQGHSPAMVSYSKPTITKAGAVNDQLSIQASTAKTDITATIKWNFNKAKWDNDDMREWKRPNDYTRISQDQIITMMSSF